MAPGKETGTILGFVDENSIDTCPDEYSNFIGGSPIYPSFAHPFPDILCSSCSRQLCLWAQIYAPICSKYHRFLYLFGCHFKDCISSSNMKNDACVVVRCQYLDIQYIKDQIRKEEKLKLAHDIHDNPHEIMFEWGTDEPLGNWDDLKSLVTEMEEEQQEQRQQSVVEKSRKVDEDKQDTISDSNPSIEYQMEYQLDRMMIYTENEVDIPQNSDLSHELELLREYERREGKSVLEVDEDWFGEKYESNQRIIDKSFKMFQETVSRYPLQCLRYHWNGNPLFYQQIQHVSMSSFPSCCHRCGGKRVFEFQLMPALLSHLKHLKPRLKTTEKDGNGCVDSKSLLNDFDFGTVLIFSCLQNCEVDIKVKDWKDELEDAKRGKFQVSFDRELAIFQKSL